jgi:hypothetical protein
MASRRGYVRRVWDFVRIARLPGGNESRNIWKLGPLCVKRWSPRVLPTEVRQRRRISRNISASNTMPYIRWRHWTLANYAFGIPASHECCNRLLRSFSQLTDFHPETYSNRHAARL